MKLEDYKVLPDRLPIEFLVSLFRNIILEFEDNNITKDEFLEILIELTDRQVMTYELLQDEVRDNLDILLSKIWNINSYDDVDRILSIVVNLGLVKCYNEIKHSIENIQNIDKKILEEILDVIEDTKGHISNPYYGLEQFK